MMSHGSGPAGSISMAAGGVESLRPGMWRGLSQRTYKVAPSSGLVLTNKVVLRVRVVLFQLEPCQNIGSPWTSGSSLVANQIIGKPCQPVYARAFSRQ
jgi:hypothetical protein